MNKNNAKDYLPLVQAMADGKMIQLKSNGCDVWRDQPDLSFSDDRENYRIKPEPRTAPLGPDDIHPGSAIRQIGSDSWQMIQFAGIDFIVTRGWPSLIYRTLMNDFEIKRPGEDWKPCSKTIEE